MEQVEQQGAHRISLNHMRKSVLSKYRDIRVAIKGSGYVFGDFECFTGLETY